MNGADLVEDGSVIDRRPVITCTGELEVFSVIEDNLIQALPQETGELRRSLGRPVRSVHIGANFAPFSPAALPKGNQWDLIRQPLFHIYWTECSDIDLYKNNIRDDIEAWLKELQSRDIPDWLVVVVENYDGKRANKLLPRTTVLDKIRADFAPKQGDRCISVINPGKPESRSADSWRGFVTRIRHLLLVAYARAVSRLEDHVRQQRERRNEPGWNFMQYFQLQEELAQVLEMLGLNDEALVQYDELDALFSQFVVNGHVGDAASWLVNFQRPLEKWHGLKLGPCGLAKNPSLLELRAYLFAKQAHMLLLSNKVWEMASRCLPFLHTCVRELSLLEISAPPGAVACWLFLASMEVLQTCDKFNAADEIKAYSLHTACLWAYASQKLRELGVLCGLMPGGTPTSEQLHTVVGLSAGMGDNPGAPGRPSSTDKLKEALCSQDVFSKTYLELAELAMGTYKHIGRLRSARLIGRDVASFYMLLGETQKSAAFLGDLLRTFEEDGWHELAAQTQLELAECHRKAGDTRKFVQACIAVCAAPEMDNLLRWSYFDEMRRSLEALTEPLTVPFENVIKIASVSVKSDSVIMQDGNIEVELVIESNFPRELCCTGVLISLELETKDGKKSKDRYLNCKSVTAKDLKPEDCTLRKLSIQRHLDYKEDKQLSSASVVCRSTPVKRKDSMPVSQKSDFSRSLEVNNLPLVLTPGINVIRLNKEARDIGKFYLGQVAIHFRQLQLISPSLSPRLAVNVKREEPTLRLDKGEEDLLSGFEQIMELTLTVGSYAIEPNSIIKLTASRGLLIEYKPDESLKSSLEIEVTQTAPFSSTRIPIRIMAELPSKEHQVTMTCPWQAKPIPVSLSFTSPLSSSWRLHTVHQRKFVQVIVTGQCDKILALEVVELIIGDNCKVKSLNPSSSQIVTNGQSVSYMWELLVKPDGNLLPIKADFSIKYKLADNDKVLKEDITYHHYIDIANYETIYILNAHVEPTKGNEFCRVGAVCHLHLTIKKVGKTSENNNKVNSLMYEVLAEQGMWAVCGRTAGVVCFDNDSEPQILVLEVMPLTSGFLPLPLVRISKYIPAECAQPERLGKLETHPKLEPFCPGQVYSSSKGQQVHVINAANEG